MTTESPTLVGQRETTCHEEKEFRHRPWIFFYVLSSSSKTRFLMRSVLTTVHPGSNCSLHHLWLVFYYHLYLITFSNQLTFKPESSPYFCLVLEGGHIHFQKFHTGTEDLGPGGGVITKVIHQWLANLQQVLWPESLRCQLVIS